MEQKLKYNPEEMLAQADEAFVEWMKNERYTDLMEVMPTLGKYSLRNQMLVMMQNPDATNVNKMNGWNYKRRHVIKDSKPIRIVAPKFATQVSTDKDGNITEKTLDTVTGYEISFVYDIAQTDGEPVKEVFADEDTALEHYDVVKAALEGSVKGFAFKTHELAEDESYGVLDTLNNTISLRADLSKQDALRTLVQQVATANVLMRGQYSKGLSASDMGNIRSVEASAITYAVCQRLNLGETTYAVPDFDGMSDKSISRFAENIGTIRSISQRIINAAEGAVSKELYEQAQKLAEKENAEAKPEVSDVKQTVQQSVKRTKATQKTKTEVAM